MPKVQTRRNDPCPCGSGRKYKHCHIGREITEPLRAENNITLPVLGDAAAAPAENTIHIQRQCDGCTACCEALIINDPDLVLPVDQPCPNLCGQGCSIHGPDMPGTCSGYLCNYLVEPGDFTVEDRPDHVGAIVRLARERHLPPPMDRTLYINEYLAGGIHRVLRNPRWRRVIRKDLLNTHPILISPIDDPAGREVIIVRYRDRGIGCNLTSCDENGEPILTLMQPVYRDTPLHIAVTRTEQNFVFDAEVLIKHLGDKPHTIIGPSASAANPSPSRFWFTRRQADILRDLLNLVGE